MTTPSPRRVLLARHADPTQPVHLLPLPLAEHRDGTAAVAYCGTRIPADLLTPEDPTRPGSTDFCVLCFTLRTAGEPPAPAPGASPFAEVTTAAAIYRDYGWSVTTHGAEIRLDLARCAAIGIALPALLAADVTRLLTTRRCVPAVLAHPAAPSHRIILAGDHGAVPLSWPPTAMTITGTLALPPTPTPTGQVLWTRSPDKHSLQLTREIDVLTALLAGR